MTVWASYGWFGESGMRLSSAASDSVTSRGPGSAAGSGGGSSRLLDGR